MKIYKKPTKNIKLNIGDFMRIYKIPKISIKNAKISTFKDILHKKTQNWQKKNSDMTVQLHPYFLKKIQKH